MMLTGILFISLCVGCYRLSNFGVDAFTCMNLGISGFLYMSFGTWQLIMNAAILAVVFFTVRKNIGAGTIGCLFAGLGVAFYIVADMGIAPYDSVAFIIQKALKGKMQFQYARVCSDVGVVAIGVLFCLASGGDLWKIVGVGTVCNACFNGPLIQFFREHVSEPIMRNRRSSE